MIPFNFHHLYYFYAVVREGSVTRAAASLRIGQPALSTQIRIFEKQLGLKLFERAGRRLEVSEEGRMVLSYAEEIFESGRQMMQAVSGGGLKGRLHTRLGLTPYVPKTIAERLICLLLEIEPDMHLDVAEDRADRLLPRLEQHELDFMLADESVGADFPDTVVHLLDRVPISFASSPKLAKKYRRIPGDLNGAPVILPTSNSRMYSEVREYFAFHGVRPRIVAEVQDVELVRRMAIAGLGIAPMNVYTLRHAPGHEKLVELNKVRLPLYRPVYLFSMPRKRPHPLFETVVRRFRLRD